MNIDVSACIDFAKKTTLSIFALTVMQCRIHQYQTIGETYTAFCFAFRFDWCRSIVHDSEVMQGANSCAMQINDMVSTVANLYPAWGDYV
jgi:hypothetical protein